MSKKSSEEGPKDVLAADEFPVGDSAEPAATEAPHDVLAADEFGMPGADSGSPESEAAAGDGAGAPASDAGGSYLVRVGGVEVTRRIAGIATAAVGGLLLVIRRGRRRKSKGE